MPAEFSRTERIGSEIMRDLAGLIRNEIRDPRIGMVTIQEVRVTRDLSLATIFYSVLNETSAGQSHQILTQAAKFLRHRLGQQIRLRKIPELRFVFDATLQNANELTALIEHAVAEDQRNHSQDNKDNGEKT